MATCLIQYTLRILTEVQTNTTVVMEKTMSVLMYLLSTPNGTFLTRQIENTLFAINFNPFRYIDHILKHFLAVSTGSHILIANYRQHKKLV